MFVRFRQAGTRLSIVETSRRAGQSGIESRVSNHRDLDRPA
jgi:hypothetical protein